MFELKRKEILTMYNLSVPIMSATVTPENREIYLKLCREAGVERIFLALDAVMEPVPQSYYDNVVYFKSHGFEVGVWTSTVGHGFELAHSEDTEKELNIFHHNVLHQCIVCIGIFLGRETELFR